MSVDLYSRSLLSHINGLKPHLQACPAFCFGSHFDSILKTRSIPQMRRAAQFNYYVTARLWSGPSLRSRKWRNGDKKSQWLPKQNAGQACRWGFKPFICERRLREYKSTLIDKGLNCFISVKLLILETIVSQRS